jgi:diguanylate cyclase (GGDEF)-like protein
MTFEHSLLSLQGLSLGDAFGASLFFPQAPILIETRKLPEAPWRWTDDTQMALAVVEELRERGWIDQDSFARRLVRGYSADPSRGYGTTTRQTLERIASGEYFRAAARAAFNGGSYSCSASARAAPVGGYFAGSPARAGREALLTAGVTHMHLDGIAGAEAVAAAAAIAADRRPPAGADFLQAVIPFVQDGKVRQGIARAIDIPAEDFSRAVRELGVGLKYLAQDTVPFSLWVAAHHLENLEEALWMAVAGMGMRDTICAIVGGIVALSARQIPEQWLKRREPLPGDLPARLKPGKSQGRKPAPPALKNRATQREGANSGQPGIGEDALTGLPNLLGLLNWVKDFGEGEESAILSLLAIQLPSLRQVNRDHGRTAGDDLLKWCAQNLQARHSGPIFRAGGDQFVVVLKEAGPAQAAAKAHELAQATDFGKGSHHLEKARLALIHFRGPGEITPGCVLAALFMALARGQNSPINEALVEFTAGELQTRGDYPWMMIDLADQMIRLGHTAGETLKLAQTDSVSQLPNMRAAMSALETALAHTRRTGEPVALLLMDGDNLRLYNQISYEAGDEAIRLLGATIQLQLRQTDFLARWRTGDEFLVLLPDTLLERAVYISQRLCGAVERASRAWLLPSTISVGIAVCPQHGQSVRELLHVAERGLEAAKQRGKNRVWVCDPEI